MVEYERTDDGCLDHFEQYESEDGFQLCVFIVNDNVWMNLHEPTDGMAFSGDRIAHGEPGTDRENIDNMIETLFQTREFHAQ